MESIKTAVQAKFGILPDLHDEAALRAWLKNAVDIAAMLAGLTPFGLDDKAAKLLGGILANDATWADLYQIILIAVPGPDLVPFETVDHPARQIAGTLNIPWDLVAKLILAIVEFLKSFFVSAK